MERVSKIIPDPSRSLQIEYLLKAQEKCFSYGLTTLGEAGLDKDQIDLLDSLQNAQLLDMRIYAMANPTEENLDHYLETGPYKTDRLSVRAFKFYADGALGSRGACLLEPYRDDNPNRGFLLHPKKYYRYAVKRIFKKSIPNEYPLHWGFREIDLLPAYTEML